MDNRRNIIIFLISLFILTYAILRFLNIIAFYTVSTPSMEPNYEVGTHIFASTLIKPDYNSVVAYKSQTIPYPAFPESEEDVFIGRIVGKGNDELEIKDGRTYINGTMIDKDISLNFLYEISPEIVKANKDIIDKIIKKNKYTHHRISKIYLSDDELQQFSEKEKPIKIESPINMSQDFPAKSFIKEGWTYINYGPIKIPENHVFIMGDSRQNSEDSRLRGFTHEDDIVATVIN